MKLATKLIFIFLTIAFTGFSQRINLQKFSVKEGLSNSNVKHIEQDNYGNLWLATNYGLNKFNGKNFEIYTTTNGLPSNEITTLLYLNDELFIGTKKGLCSFNGFSITQSAIQKKVTGVVKKLLEYKNSLHVITTKGYYILSLSQNEQSIDSVAISEITSQQPTDAEFDSDGNLWISTSKKGLFFIENNISTKIPKLVLIQNSSASTSINKKMVRIVNFTSNNILKGNAIISIEFDNKNDLYLSDWGNGIALLKFNTLGQGNSFSPNYLSIDSTINGNVAVSRYVNIQKDIEGNLFLATDGFGVIKIPIDKNTNENNFNDNSILWLDSKQGFFGNNPTCFKHDKSNNIWIGTLNDGLILLNDKSSLSYNQKLGLEEEKVISLYYGSDSAIWLGTYGGGAFRFKNKKFKRCFWDQGITESIIKTLCEDNYGNIWLGTVGGGISIISKENTTKDLTISKAISETNGLLSNFVNYIYKGKNGTIWVGYYNQNKIDKIITNKDGTYSITTIPITNLLNFNVSCIVEDDMENIWITSPEGVWIYNAKTDRVNNDYLMFKNIQTIAQDWNGNMWLGTSDIGTIILKNKLKVRYSEKAQQNAFEKIDLKSGISSNCINTILFEKEAVWLITNNGLNELKVDKYLNQIKEIKNYHKGNTFASFDNKPNTATFDSNGIIWIGSVEGLTQYNNSVNNSQVITPINVYINSIKVDNKNIDWTDPKSTSEGEFKEIKFDGFINWYKIPKNLELDYGHNSISFFINTDNISEQKQINYAYKLIGYDKDFNILYNLNEITYRNLPPNDYSLVIKASLSNDFQNASEFTYQFSVTPPFWKTKTFYFFIILSGLFGLYYLIISREKRLKREKVKLEMIVKARTQEIEAKKREIEIQNNLIQGINNDLTDSIKYAQRIQKTILPNSTILNNYYSENFIFYKPRNIVSGDYYWIKEVGNMIYVAVVDCTGHGVPGAFMSLISSGILNDSVNSNINSVNPVSIIEHLRKEINIKLNQNDTELVKDGLDIALICYDKSKQTIEFVNANRPLYLISKNELVTLNSENISIGGYADETSVVPTKTISVKEGDQLFLFTDGITDQFGGDKNKKYNAARLRQFLLMHNHLPMKKIGEKLSNEIKEWQGSYEQTDDILIVGLKI